MSGRILAELAREVPDIEQHFDAVVAENGAVLRLDGRERVLGRRVSPALVAQLEAERVHCRRGRSIVALGGEHDALARAALVRLGLDDQLIRNRSELMILPAGVSKASGLREALAELGISVHNTIAVGDAENDIAMLECSEIGVAVAGAVPSLKARADVILTDPGPEAVALFLSSELAADLAKLESRRHRVALGTADDGSALTVPASHAQLSIDGSTGAGKSYLAGLFVERLVRQGYTATVLDFEGDHAELGQLRGVLTLGGAESLPPPREVARLVRHRFTSLVLDLSLRQPEVKAAYAREVVERLTETRSECGLPHWIVVEEAHVVPAEVLARARAGGNLCLVTYHPEWLPSDVLLSADYLVTVEAAGRARLRHGPRFTREIGFTVLARETPHVRHRRKYAESDVPFERGFTFRAPGGEVGRHVTSLAAFAAELAVVPPKWVEHHAAHRDFSRWIRDVFQDQALFGAVREAEETFAVRDVDSFRTILRSFITLRYAIDDAPGAEEKVLESA